MSATVRSRAARAFTLIELLVVVAIIAILASLLMSGVRLAQDAAKLSICGRQMQQVILAWTAYRGEWEGQAPMAYPNDPGWNTWSTWVHRPWEKRWQHVLEDSYLETFTVFNCPSARRMYPNAAVLNSPLGAFPRGVSTANGVPSGWSICLMAYNTQTWGRSTAWSQPGPMTDGKAQRHISSVPGARLDRSPVFMDGKWQNDGTNHQNNGNGVWWPHRGKRSPMGFKDGHTEVIAYTDVTSWNPLQVQ